MNYDSHLIFEAYLLSETRKEVKGYINTGKLDPEVGKKIIDLDPHPKKTYSGWMARQYMAGNVQDFNQLSSIMQEFHVLLQRRRTAKTNLGEYKTFQELVEDVNRINNTGEGLSRSELENDFEVLVDTPDILVVSPNTHEASKKLGKTEFTYFDKKTKEPRDSNWCTTYNNADHWNRYYYNDGITFYYIKIRSAELMEKVRNAGYPAAFVVTAVGVTPENKLKFLFDGFDDEYSADEARKFLDLIGLQ